MFGALFDAIAWQFGYVKLSEMISAIDIKTVAEKELRHKTRNLEQQLMLRDRLETEIDFLRKLELAHARRDSGICDAVNRMDTITENLLQMMRSVWPEANTLSLDDKEQTTTAAA